MKIERIVVGPLQVNCYIVYDEKSREAMIVDPGDDAAGILSCLERHKLQPRYIVCTHGHFDHVGAVSELKSGTGANVALHREDLYIYENARDQAFLWGFSVEPQPYPDIFLEEGYRMAIGGVEFVIMHTPGHSPGGVCLHHEDLLFTGDTIFAGSIGRTDFHGGSLSEMKRSFRRIIDMPPATRLLPGHGPDSTVAIERETNFFINEL